MKHPRNARPLTSVKLSCGHWEYFKYLPAKGDTAWCIRCRKWPTVVTLSEFMGCCDQCDFVVKTTKEQRATKLTEEHAKENGHCGKIIGTNLEMRCYDYTTVTPADLPFMLESGEQVTR